MICLFISYAHIEEMYFNLMTWVGLTLSVGIIYKESYNKDFLQRFCKVGTVVDCNKILHSKIANIGGFISLGEMALIYFSTLFLYMAIRGTDYLAVCTLATAVAGIITLWSVVYQVFIAETMYALYVIGCDCLGTSRYIIQFHAYGSIPAEFLFNGFIAIRSRSLQCCLVFSKRVNRCRLSNHTVEISERIYVILSGVIGYVTSYRR